MEHYINQKNIPQIEFKKIGEDITAEKLKTLTQF